MALRTQSGRLQLPVLHPALVEHRKRRAESFQNRVADTITAFAGSMVFVYVHMVWFSLWILLGAEPFPFGLLTMIVSLEAIFLSTFLMISQNRADDKRQTLAEHEWMLVQKEEEQNATLLNLSTQILDLTGTVHELTTAIHGVVVAKASG